MTRPSDDQVATPKQELTFPEFAMFSILGKRVHAVAIKRVCEGTANLRPGSLLIFLMDDGTVAVFDNTDESISTTGGPNIGGWDKALTYMGDSMRVVHQYQFDEHRPPNKVRGESEDYL